MAEPERPDDSAKLSSEAECDAELERLKLTDPIVSCVFKMAQVVGMPQRHAMKILAITLAEELAQARQRSLYYASRAMPLPLPHLD